MTEDPGVRDLWVTRLGRMGYAEALELQRAVARDRISGAIPQDVLLLVLDRLGVVGLSHAGHREAERRRLLLGAQR